MGVEIIVGLFVADEEIYKKYREKMYPILESHRGRFRYDFKVSEVLESEVDSPINRVFAIFFETEELMKAFYANEDYVQIRNEYFDAAVSAKTIISKHHTKP